MIAAVPIDMSTYSEAILEKAMPYLSSPQPQTREDTQSLVSALAKQCSDASSAKTAINQLSAAFKSKL